MRPAGGDSSAVRESVLRHPAVGSCVFNKAAAGACLPGAREGGEGTVEIKAKEECAEDSSALTPAERIWNLVKHFAAREESQWRHPHLQLVVQSPQNDGSGIVKSLGERTADRRGSCAH